VTASASVRRNFLDYQSLAWMQTAFDALNPHIVSAFYLDNASEI
jgi:hypothetical protein